MSAEEMEQLAQEIFRELERRWKENREAIENPLDSPFLNSHDAVLTLSRIVSSKASSRLQSALAERTEQCAKMIQDFGVSDKWVTWNNPRCGYDCHHGRSMDLLAAEIRALNQPENKS